MTYTDADYTVYLTGVSNDRTRLAASDQLYGRLGVLLGPETAGGPGSKSDYTTHIPDYRHWGMDNGCFSNAGSFDETAWLDRLSYIVNEIPDAWDTCLFAVAPDVFDPSVMEGLPLETIERSLPVFPKIRALGIPAALVAQDGLHLMADEIPWDDFDVLFIGGSDRFKLGCPSFVPAFGEKHPGNPHYAADDFGASSEDTILWMEMIVEAHKRGKDVHVGRVNSQARLAFSQGIGARSADGTYLAYNGGQKGVDRIAKWLDSTWGVQDDEPAEAVQQLLFAA